MSASVIAFWGLVMYSPYTHFKVVGKQGKYYYYPCYHSISGKTWILGPSKSGPFNTLKETCIHAQGKRLLGTNVSYRLNKGKR